MVKLKDLIKVNETVDYYSEIRQWIKENPNRNVYIWGTGSVAAGVLKVCKEKEIYISGCFVDIPSPYHDSRIGNITVYQFKELVEQGEPFAVIIGHSRYELAKKLEKNNLILKIWCLTSVTRDDISISAEFFEKYCDLFQKTYDSLNDQKSRKNMEAYLNTKITGDNDYILGLFEKTTTYFSVDIMKYDTQEVYLDIGAYDGKSLKEFQQYCSSDKEIWAVEVMPFYAEMLQKKFADNQNVHIQNVGVSDHNGIDYFNFDDQSTCLASSSKGTALPVKTIDALSSEIGRITTIKMCIGNSVIPLLKGARITVSKYLPKMIIVAGIDSRALIDYIPLLKELSQNRYRYYLRFINAMAEALVLYAIPV